MYVIKVDNERLYTNVFDIPVSTNDVDMAMCYARDLSRRFPEFTYQVFTELSDMPVGGKYIAGRLYMPSGVVF